MEFSRKDLKKHICRLREEGLEGAIDLVSDRPRVQCSRCGAQANSLRSVCAVQLGVPEPAEGFA